MTSWSSFSFHISLLLLRFNLKILTTLLFVLFLVIYILCSMGLGMKSLTGSRKVVEILNNMGHSISYRMEESMETEIAS